MAATSFAGVLPLSFDINYGCTLYIFRFYLYFKRLKSNLIDL